jgi:hypothetical protein
LKEIVVSSIVDETTVAIVPSDGPLPTPGGPLSYIHWGPVIAGALIAAAVASILHAFATAIGLGVSSTAPTWRDASLALWLLAGLYLIFVALLSYGCGAYLTGRVRSSWTTSKDEIEFRDGAHGILVWALASLLTALLAFGAAQLGTRLAAPSGGAAAPSSSVVGENIIAYDLDRLFRAEQRPANIDLAYSRAEAARILLMASGRAGVTTDDRAYLMRLTAANTGLAPAEAQMRADTAITSASDNIRRARRSSVILAFTIGSAALLGAAVAWIAAGVGGKQRDEAIPAPLRPR